MRWGVGSMRSVASVLREDHAKLAYEALAPGYDDLTRGHDHAGWTALLESRAHEFGLDGLRLLDVACGTGNTIVPMLDRGYAVTGVDISASMLDEARRKTGGRARLVAADMRDLPILGEFDLVWCLGDALNYVDTQDELAAAFVGMRRNLAPAGVVVFDVNTLGTFRKLFSSLLVIPGEDRVILLEGRAAGSLSSGSAASASIDRLERQRSGWWHRVRSEHHHRHHPDEIVCAALQAARLDPMATFGTEVTGVIEAPLDELHHVKAVYIARHVAH